MKADCIDINSIALGPDGTVVLTDDWLALLAAMPGACDSGGDGQVNINTCTNSSSCNDTSNGHCSNAEGACMRSTNNNQCMIIVE